MDDEFRSELNNLNDSESIYELLLKKIIKNNCKMK